MRGIGVEKGCEIVGIHAVGQTGGGPHEIESGAIGHGTVVEVAAYQVEEHGIGADEEATVQDTVGFVVETDPAEGFAIVEEEFGRTGVDSGEGVEAAEGSGREGRAAEIAHGGPRPSGLIPGDQGTGRENGRYDDETGKDGAGQGPHRGEGDNGGKHEEREKDDESGKLKGVGSETNNRKGDDAAGDTATAAAQSGGDGHSKQGDEEQHGRPTESYGYLKKLVEGIGG